MRPSAGSGRRWAVEWNAFGIRGAEVVPASYVATAVFGGGSNSSMRMPTSSSIVRLSSALLYLSPALRAAPLLLDQFPELAPHNTGTSCCASFLNHLRYCVDELFCFLLGHLYLSIDGHAPAIGVDVEPLFLGSCWSCTRLVFMTHLSISLRACVSAWP